MRVFSCIFFAIAAVSIALGIWGGANQKVEYAYDLPSGETITTNSTSSIYLDGQKLEVSHNNTDDGMPAAILIMIFFVSLIAGIVIAAFWWYD